MKEIRRQMVRLGDYVEIVSGQHILEQDYNTNGIGVPYLTGPSDFSGAVINCTKYTMNPKAVCQAGDVLLTVKGSGTGKVTQADRVYCISRQLMAVRAKGIDRNFLLYLLQNAERNYNAKSDGLIPGIGRNDVADLKFPLLSATEQSGISSILITLDQSIILLSRLIAAKEQRRQYLLSSLIPSAYLQRKASQYPVVPLSSVTREATSRNNGMFDGRALMAVTKAEGMVPMREHVRGKSLDRCLVVEPGAFAYNPMRLNIGSIAQWRGRSPAIVSPDYVVFGCDPLKLDSDYARYLIATSHWRRFVQRAGDGSVRVRIYYDTLRSFRLVLPPLQEQRRIAAILSACGRELELHRRELELLKQQKRGLMQGLFTGRLPLPDSINGHCNAPSRSSQPLLSTE